jgi:hypothetical protein
MMMAAPVQLSPTFQHENAQALFSTEPYRTNIARNYDVKADGKQFVMIKDVAVGAPGRQGFIIVTNWLEEMRAKTAGAK